jgi:HK97 family phage portal protein
MAILDRLFPRRPTSEALSIQGQTRKIGGIKAVSETPGVLWSRTNTSAGVHVDEFEALTISGVFAACFRLANVAAMLPVGIYQKNADGRREEQSAHPASRILAIEANPVQTAFMARHFMQFWKPLFGAACAEIGWDGAGRPRYLWPLEPWRVYPKYDEDTHDLMYFVVDGTRKVAPADIIYVPHMTDDGVCGVGFIQYALESIGQSIAADRSAGRFFQNDMRPGGILQHDGNPDKKARDEMREGWQRYHGGVENRGKVGVLWGGWKWIREAGMIEPDKAQLLETRQFSVLEVARWLNVPPHWLAELGRATWNNIESQSIEALIYTVAPLLTATEQEWDRKLLAPPRLYCKHNVNALLRADMKTRAEFYGKMKEIGVYTTNMILAFEDENGIGSEGDQRFVPVNWQPADDLMTGGEAQQKAAAAGKQAGTTGQQDPGSGGKSPASGGNQKQSPANPPAPVVTGQPSAEQISYAVCRVAEQVLSGLAKKEINEARRAAKKPGEVMTWMDGFYPDFEGLMADSLGPIAHLCYQLGRQVNPELKGVSSEPWAKQWADASRAELLAAMECKAEEWPNKSAALLQAWEGRAAVAAAKIAEGVA